MEIGWVSADRIKVTDKAVWDEGRITCSIPCDCPSEERSLVIQRKEDTSTVKEAMKMGAETGRTHLEAKVREALQATSRSWQRGEEGFSPKPQKGLPLPPPGELPVHVAALPFCTDGPASSPSRGAAGKRRQPQRACRLGPPGFCVLHNEDVVLGGSPKFPAAHECIHLDRKSLENGEILGQFSRG